MTATAIPERRSLSYSTIQSQLRPCACHIETPISVQVETSVHVSSNFPQESYYNIFFSSFFRFGDAEKQPHNIIDPPLRFTVGMVFLGQMASPNFLQTYFTSSWPNNSIFVSSDHKTRLRNMLFLSRCSLVNFSRAFKWISSSSGVILGRCLCNSESWTILDTVFNLTSTLSFAKCSCKCFFVVRG